jgi:hypothetical protein
MIPDNFIFSFSLEVHFSLRILLSNLFWCSIAIRWDETRQMTGPGPQAFKSFLNSDTQPAALWFHIAGGFICTLFTGHWPL